MKNIAIICTLALALCFCSCSKQQDKDDIHVILIGLDGWEGCSIEKSDMPMLKELMKNGAYTLKERSVLESSSALNWASMFMGAAPEIHGYTEWNSRVPEIPSAVIYKHNIFPTISQILRDQRPDAEIGCIYEWTGIKFLVDTLSCNYFHETDRFTPGVNERTCAASEQYIKEKKPNLLTIAIDRPDWVGHGIGHATREYYAALHELDGYIARIVQATKDAGIYENTVFVFSADHGGQQLWHGGRSLEEMEIPFIISGKGIKKMGEFKETMMQYDTAPTIAHIFGLTVPQAWNGRPMLQVFE